MKQAAVKYQTLFAFYEIKPFHVEKETNSINLHTLC